MWKGKQTHAWTRLLDDEGANEPNWRSVLAESWQDSTRTAISEQELVHKQWMVSFWSRWEGRVARQGYFLSTGIYHNNKGHHASIHKARTRARTRAALDHLFSRVPAFSSMHQHQDLGCSLFGT